MLTELIAPSDDRSQGACRDCNMDVLHSVCFLRIATI